MIKIPRLFLTFSLSQKKKKINASDTRYLWPIFHYMPLSEHQDKKDENLAWKAYSEVNYAFAQRIASVYQPGDLIWIQDYQ
jgi:trehalose 6-phosphate synthase/phosphatase